MGIFTKIFQRGQEPGRGTDDDAERDHTPTEPMEQIVNEPENKGPPGDPESEAKERSARLLSPTPRIAGGVQVVPHVPKKTPPKGEPITPPPIATPAPFVVASTKPPRGDDQTLLMTPTHPRPGQQGPRAKSKTAPGTLAKAVSQPIAKEPSGPTTIPVGTPVPSGRPAVEARPGPPPRRTPKPTADVLAEALRELAEGEAEAKQAEGRSTAGDLAAARKLFDDLAVDHVTQVRDVMLELSLGDVPLSWVESTKPALRSLRAMAQQMEQADLCGALDDFCTAVDHALASGQSQVTDTRKTELQAKYQRLIDLIPKAFELDAERDRREPIIVECLLRQVEGVEDLTIHKLFGVGLGRLMPLLQANAGDIAATSGISIEIANQIVARLHIYRGSTASTMTAPDAAAEHKELRGLVTAMKKQHDEFERASAGWSDGDRAKKKAQRKERDQTFLRVKLALARLGERDRITKLERAPFSERIADLDRYLAEVASARSRGGQHPTTQQG
jgi:hypothetical protein